MFFIGLLIYVIISIHLLFQQELVIIQRDSSGLAISPSKSLHVKCLARIIIFIHREKIQIGFLGLRKPSLEFVILLCYELCSEVVTTDCYYLLYSLDN